MDSSFFEILSQEFIRHDSYSVCCCISDIIYRHARGAVRVKNGVNFLEQYFQK